MKKLKGLLLGLAMAVIATGCAAGGADKTEEKPAEKESYTIGISQFAQHGSLDNCREGFLKGLAENGIVEGENLTIDYQNAEASTANANTIAQNFVGNKVDLIAAIATPSAMSAFNAALDTEIPLVYTAITDPVAAQLATEDGKSTGNVTGTSDILPVEEQLKLMREMLPEAKTIGILYTTSEANSVSMIKRYEDLAPKYNFTLVTEGVSATADIPLAADSILEKVDALTNLTDNTVVSSLPLILDKANAKKIPVFGSEIEQVKIGCLAAKGIDYDQLGVQTGNMAAKILKGEAKASDIPFESIESPLTYVNKAAAENLGIEIPQTVTEQATETFDKVESE
ncbi:MAG: ABC transporter substrate-binding protein [Gallicola sp.]|nr:ABC transporter substrate-binding protein [Gallicola sp.]